MHAPSHPKELSPSDQTLLVLLAQTGDRAALEQLLRNSRAPLRRYITRWAGADLANDILQAVRSRDDKQIHQASSATESGYRRAVLGVAINDSLVIHNNTCYCSGIMSTVEKTISFRAVAEKIDSLDSLAAAQDRSRSYLINEAITNYIELHAYQDALVRKGLAEMRKGRVVNHEEVVKRLRRAGRARA